MLEDRDCFILAIIMAYHFIFRETIYYDEMPIRYEVPDYLSYEDATHHRHCIVYKYISMPYDTIEQAMVDYYEVLAESGQSITPDFYENEVYMSNSTALFNNYLRVRDAEE